MTEIEIQNWRIQRLQALVDKEGGKAAVGRKLGYKDGAFVGQMLRGERPITEKTVLAVHDLAGCKGWFDGLSESAQTIPSITGTGLAVTSPNRRTEDVVIPQYDTGGKMGDGLVLKEQPGLIKSWTVSPDWVQLNVHRITATKNLAIVTGFGDSMQPLYNPGDPLLVDRGVKRVDVDGIYFFRVGDEGFIKRLQRIPTKGILVISDNQKYRDWTISANDDFEVFGKIVKAWRGEDF